MFIYRATVTTSNDVQTYVGLTAGPFKDRFYAHDGDFRDSERRTSTELSSYIWSLKDKNEGFNIEWEVVRRAKPFSPVNMKCELCLAEKFEIIFNPSTASLNQRHELYNHCRHRAKLFLVRRKRKKRIPGE